MSARRPDAGAMMEAIVRASSGVCGVGSLAA